MDRTASPAQAAPWLRRTATTKGGGWSTPAPALASGALAGVVQDGIDTRLLADEVGNIASVSRDGDLLVRYAYLPDGRVGSILFGDGQVASYAYNRRGLRENAMYGTGAVSRMRYDAAGNLVHYAVDHPNGRTTRQDYDIDGFNRLLGIRNSGVLDASFRYDSLGRLFDVQTGDRSTWIDYDAADRVRRVDSDGVPLLRQDYGVSQPGIVAAADGRTASRRCSAQWTPSSTRARGRRTSGRCPTRRASRASTSSPTISPRTQCCVRVWRGATCRLAARCPSHHRSSTTGPAAACSFRPSS